MDRTIVYPSAIPLDTDLLAPQRAAMISDGILAQAMLGTGTTVCGLACTPLSPAGMQVTVGPGAIFSQQVVDAIAFGSLSSNSNALVKVGINLEAWTSPVFAAPSAGNAVNVLITAALAETDTDPVLLPYYNAANPAQSFAGPNNTSAALNSRRTQRVALTVVAGAPYATNATPVFPPAAAGSVSLYVITINSGTTAITAGMISVASGAPFIGGGTASVGRLINVQNWTSHGTYTYIQTPGTNSRIWEVRGAGGSGGSVASTSAGSSAAAGGGGGGAYVKHLDTSVSNGATLVVGQGGAAPANGANYGNAGGQSSVSYAFLSLIAPGGGGAGGCSAQSTSALVGAGTPGALGAGGNLVNASGSQGGFGQTIIAGASFFGVSGVGGSGHAGGGGASVGSTSAGNAGHTPGSGGSGAASGCTPGGGGAESGGAGADGGIWVWEFA